MGELLKSDVIVDIINFCSFLSISTLPNIVYFVSNVPIFNEPDEIV